MSYPYLAKTTLKYKSPHATDLSFAKDETIRVTGPSPDDEDWLVGELLDGSKSGGFPKDFIVPIEGESGADAVEAAAPPPAPAPVQTEAAAPPDEPPVPISAPAPPSPKLEPAELPKATPEPTPAPTPAPVASSTPAEPAASDDPSSPPRQSMKERLAFFAAAQNKVAPPPPVKPKPITGGLTWSQRQKLRQEQEAKEAAERGDDAAAPVESAPAVQPTAEAASAPVPDDKTDKPAGMSASDAASSIGQGGSLKERMAALRAGGAFGAPAQDAPPAPKPSGKTWTRPPAPPAPEPEEEDAVEAPESVQTPANDDASAPPGGDDEEEQTEEEKEKARRAAIAARMAKLGARGPMGMAPAAPPKPARKPTSESVKSPAAEDRPEPTLPPAAEQSEPASAPAPSQPTSIPIAAMPRRAAPPRRRGPVPTAAAPGEDDKRLERVDPDGTISPPPQVMVADEEEPLPKTEEQLALEKQHEEAARGDHGAAGAAAAGIALAPVTSDSTDSDDAPIAPLVGALGNAGSDSRGVGTVADHDGGEIKHVDEEPVHEVEEGLAEGGAEKDDILEDAAAGRIDVQSPEEHASPRPVGVVPLHPPAPSGPPSDVDEDDAPPPPPPRHGMTDFPQDEVERKHDHDAQHAVEDGDDDDSPVPLPRTTRLGSDRPLGPRPLPSPGVGADRALPPPPTGNPLVPPRDDSEDERELGDEGDVDEEDVPPPPPRRQATMPVSPVAAMRAPAPPTDAVADAHDDDDDDAPAPLPPRRESTILPPAAPSTRDAAAPILADEDAPAPPPRRMSTAPMPPAADDEADDAPPPPPARKPTLPPPIETAAMSNPTGPVSPSSPQVTRSPTAIRSPSSQGPPSPVATRREELGSPTEQDDDKSRRSGIAARMAKLGGVKFGMPPPVPKKSFSSSDRDQARPSHADETPRSPVAEEPSVPETPSTQPPAPSAPVDDDDESPEAQAARRRATLARLRAGGALGFGMFNHGPAAGSEEDARGLEAEQPVADEEVPPAPPARAAPIEPAQDDDDEAPPPPARPPIPTPATPASAPQDSDDAPPPPLRPIRTSTDSAPMPPGSPVRSPSGRRPPIPAADRRLSGQLPPSSPVASRTSESGTRWDISEEPAVMMMSQDDDPPPPPPNRPPPSGSIPAQSPPLPPTHHRSASTASRVSRSSRLSTDVQSYSPTMRQPPAGQGMPAPAPQTEQPLPPTPGESAPRQSISASGQRPGYDALVNASKDSGARLARAARAMFDQGKKAYYGDGSPAGFVLIALDNAHIARPQSGWGQLVYEQEAASVLKRYDEPRAGDIAAFHDARLKGRKGLSGYEQHVGSVEEPLLGVVVDFETKNKHKVKVLQVERGVPEEVSYRLDDLKTGRVAIYRPGL